MLYSKKNDKELSAELFKDPTSEFRGFPFWAWNNAVDNGEVVDQIDIFKEMGFGGYYMHVRQGLETEYLGEGFMQAIEDCVEKSRRLGMYACLYDEDRWPSGPAGGLLTKNIRYRARYLEMRCDPYPEHTCDEQTALEQGTPLYLGSYLMDIDVDGLVRSYTPVDVSNPGQAVRHFYVTTDMNAQPRFNYQTYSDNLSKEAIDEFIKITHEKYFARVGADFGKTVPTIFFDEPQPIFFKALENAFSRERCTAPWTLSFAQKYKEEWGEDIYPRVPEIFFVMKDGSERVTLYRYMRLVSECFNSAFCDNIGEWCESHGIMATGHMMCEQDLHAICRHGGGDAMRGYKKMQFPGIDLLCDGLEITTAKQCQSAVHQYGREGMMSELYGVAGWDFDFAAHKHQGDWQACMGVTMRVPHLSWQTMKGEGKRDYPTSIFYQAPWYKEYKYIEDHFARIGTALTRGEPVVRVAVVHPVETYWMNVGSLAESVWAPEMNERFLSLARMLTDLSIDFNYISESLLPDLADGGSNPLKVGKMEYDAVILSDCETLRPHTLKVLSEFVALGGKLITVGKTPHLENALPSKEAQRLADSAEHIDLTELDLGRELAPYREVDIRRDGGGRLHGICYALRRDGEGKWLFIARTDKQELRRLHKKDSLAITVNGHMRPTLYDTVSGNTRALDYELCEGTTRILADMWSNDSLLIWLTPTEEQGAPRVKSAPAPATVTEERGRLPFRTEEPNVVVLDMAEYSLDGEQLRPTEELMKVDRAVRQRLGYTLREAKFAQPYCISSSPEDHVLTLKFTVNSEITYHAPTLALEDAKKMKITFNGVEVDNTPVGYYVDKHIDTVTLPDLKVGENLLTVQMPFGLRTDIENMYLLGDFGVRVTGRYATVTARPATLAFGSIVDQGYPFYSGNLVYESTVELSERSDLTLELTYIRGAAAEVYLDGERQMVALSPNVCTFKDVAPGTHKLEYRLLGNRNNTFSSLHNLAQDFPTRLPYCGPGFWRSVGQEFSYEYYLHTMGIMKAPILRITAK